MSSHQAFVSFVEWAKDRLSEIDDLTVIVRGDKKPAQGAYLAFDAGVEIPRTVWTGTLLFQARLMVSASKSRPAFIEGGEMLDSIMDLIRDGGTLDKLDYRSDGSKVKTGIYNYRVDEATGDISNDPKKYENIITFKIYTNFATK